MTTAVKPKKPVRRSKAQSDAMKRRALGVKLPSLPIKTKRTPEEVAEARRVGAEKRRLMKEAKIADVTSAAHLIRMADLAAQAEDRGITVKGLDKLAVAPLPPKLSPRQKQQAADKAIHDAFIEECRRSVLENERRRLAARSDNSDATHAEAIQYEAEAPMRAFNRKKAALDLKYGVREMCARLDWYYDG